MLAGASRETASTEGPSPFTSISAWNPINNQTPNNRCTLPSISISMFDALSLPGPPNFVPPPPTRPESLLIHFPSLPQLMQGIVHLPDLYVLLRPSGCP
eukprot:6678031-Pyramimonas_sp.AAC.1